MEPDFSTLPDITLVKVMTYLKLSDRYHLSTLCHRLYNTFHHPSLWRNATIKLLGVDRSSSFFKTFVPEWYYTMVAKFGKYFHSLKLIISGHFCCFLDEGKSLLRDLGQQCQLESLTIKVGVETAPYHLDGNQPKADDLMAILSFVHNAAYLKHFTLYSWPMFPDVLIIEELNIFHVLANSQKLKSLESLNLFWDNDIKWTVRTAILPHPHDVVCLLANFTKLVQLSLRSPMLSEAVIQQLCIPKYSTLKLFRILITYSLHDPSLKIPEISSSTWEAFVRQNPDVHVEFTVMTRVSAVELAALLKPEVPVVSLSFLHHSYINSQIITSVADKYYRTLQTLHICCDAPMLDDIVLDLVVRCQNLASFVYHGKLTSATVEALAMLKGSKWTRFDILGAGIITKDVVDSDENVIRQEADGKWIMNDFLRFYEDEESQQEKLDNMKKNVCKSLGYRWCPL